MSTLAFASTSLDSLAVMVPLLAGERGEPGPTRSVVTGYALGAASVVALAWSLGLLGEYLRPQTVGWLGLVPLSIGLLGVVRLARGGPPPEAAETSLLGRGTLAMTALTLSLSGDNLAVLVPLFADTRRALDPAILAGCGLAVAVWIGLALRIARWPALAHVLETWAPRGVPFLLIAIGVYVLLDTATDVD